MGAQFGANAGSSYSSHVARVVASAAPEVALVGLSDLGLPAYQAALTRKLRAAEVVLTLLPSTASSLPTAAVAVVPLCAQDALTPSFPCSPLALWLCTGPRVYAYQS